MEKKKVTFEQAVKLKEKGYDRQCHDLFFEDGMSIEGSFIKAHDDYLRPKLSEVVDWFLEEHGVWIYTYPVAPYIVDDDDYPKIVWVSKICSLNQINFEKFIDADNGLAINHHRTSDDAISAAIDYMLK
jgi:hypothetical protein